MSSQVDPYSIGFQITERMDVPQRHPHIGVPYVPLPSVEVIQQLPEQREREHRTESYRASPITTDLTAWHMAIREYVNERRLGEMKHAQSIRFPSFIVIDEPQAAAKEECHEAFDFV